MGIKQRIRNSKKERELIISQNVKGVCTVIGTRFNVRDRIAQANSWCNNHPLVVFLVALGILIFSTAATIRSFLNYKAEVAIPLFDTEFLESNIVSRTMSLSETSRDVMTSKMRQVVSEVQQDINMIDSLMALPALSHQDSMKVWMATERLNSFNQKFTNDKY